jgi:hypothetical protein
MQAGLAAALRVVKRAAEAAGLDPPSFSGHDLRAGLVTAAATYGGPLARIQDATCLARRAGHVHTVG